MKMVIASDTLSQFPRTQIICSFTAESSSTTSFGLYPSGRGLRGHVYITGHTHVPLNENCGYTHLNPGSISLPKENSAHGYILSDYFGLPYIVSVICAIIPFTAWIFGALTRYGRKDCCRYYPPYRTWFYPLGCWPYPYFVSTQIRSRIHIKNAPGKTVRTARTIQSTSFFTTPLTIRQIP